MRQLVQVMFFGMFVGNFPLRGRAGMQYLGLWEDAQGRNTQDCGKAHMGNSRHFGIANRKEP